RAEDLQSGSTMYVGAAAEDEDTDHFLEDLVRLLDVCSAVWIAHDRRRWRHDGWVARLPCGGLVAIDLGLIEDGIGEPADERTVHRLRRGPPCALRADQRFDLVW